MMIYSFLGNNVLNFSLTIFIQYALQKYNSSIVWYFWTKIDRVKKYEVSGVVDVGLVISMPPEKMKGQRARSVALHTILLRKWCSNCVVTHWGRRRNRCPRKLHGMARQKVLIYAMKILWKRYDIGTLESYEQIKQTYNGIKKR